MAKPLKYYSHFNDLFDQKKTERNSLKSFNQDKRKNIQKLI